MTGVIQFSNSGHDSSPAFFGRPRAGRIPEPSFHRPSNNEGARNAGAQAAPQPRVMCELEFTRVSHHGIAEPLAFRARCFEGLLGPAPGGQTFQAAHLGDQPPNHRCGASMHAACTVTSRHRAHRHEPRRGTPMCLGTERFGPAGRGNCAASPTPLARPPLPAPASGDADQTPLVTRAGWMGI